MKFTIKFSIKIVLIAIIVLIVFSLGVVKYSTSPYFCKSCHIMQPYYNAWKTSKHNNVACVECHYPPTDKVKEALWHKFQALSQVAKYVTRTYSSKPYAEIKDESCLRNGCHSTRLLQSKVIFKNEIVFDHKPHLEQVRRGRHLKCTSCHSQMVVGKHVEVTVDTCFLCHFKDKKHGRELSPLGGCLSCHKIPEKPFIIKNITYRHTDFVIKQKVSCEKCHIDAVIGDGEAPKERCFTCHNQPEKLEKYKDIPFLHDNHVTKHNVACFHCHKEIKHGYRVAVKEKKEVLFECNLCHLDKHTAQKEIYAGKGGIGITEMPSPMFLSNVDCVACHTNLKDDSMHGNFSGKTFFADESACLKCHGDKYKGIMDDSKKIIDETIHLLKEKLVNAKTQLEKTTLNKNNEVKKLLDKAESNIKFVEVSHGIHNIYYATQLLRKSDTLLDQIKSKIKIELNDLSENQLISGGFCANLCHQKIGVSVPAEFVTYQNKKMPHKKHYDEINIKCIQCHEFGQHKQVIFKPTINCGDCHN